MPEPGTHFAQQFMPTILLILTSLGLLALVLSSFLVINVITAIVTQQMKQIGIMKSVGATPRQIAGLYFPLVLFYGVCAIALAIPLGALGSTVFATFIAGQLNFDIRRFCDCAFGACRLRWRLACLCRSWPPWFRSALR